MDSKLQEVLLDYGLEGYGLYFYCLELIAASVEVHNLNFELEHDARIIARNTGSTVEKVQSMMTRFVELKLFENTDGVITCLKMLTRADEYTQKIIRKEISNGNISLDSVPTLSRQSQDKIPPNRIEENRIEENRRDEKQKAPKTSKKKHTTLKTYIENCKSENVEAIPLDSIVFKNAGKIGLSNEFVNVAWFCFKAYWIEDKPRSTKADWLIAFNNCLTCDGYGTYRKNQQGEFYLTTKGKNMLEIMRSV